MGCDRPPQALDTVVWERDGGRYSGLIWEVRGGLASILTEHRNALVFTEDLTILIRHEDWNPEALQNHLWAVYGVRLPGSDDCPPDNGDDKPA
jgi:hypothetical protein